MNIIQMIQTDMKNYLAEFGDELNISVDAENDRAVEAMYFVYSKDKKMGKYDAISDVDRVLDGFDNDGMLSIMTRMEEMIFSESFEFSVSSSWFVKFVAKSE